MTNQINRAIIIVFICVTLVSCNSMNAPIAITASALTATNTTTSPILINPAPTYTSTASLTQTLESIATLTPMPMLSQQTSESEIKELLQNDTNCKMPCFLGVIPEKTTVEELRNIFNRYRIPLHDYEGKGLAYAIERFPNSDVPPEAVFHISDGLVKSTRVYPNESNQFEWSIYSPSAILRHFGTPSKVTFGLRVIHEPTPTPWKGWYRMTFYYDNLGIIINYGDPEIVLDELITVCPNKDEFVGSRIWLGNSPYYPPSQDADGPLEDVTSFTLESFKEYLLLGPGACFYLKRDAIPIY